MLFTFVTQLDNAIFQRVRQPWVGLNDDRWSKMPKIHRFIHSYTGVPEVVLFKSSEGPQPKLY